MVSPASSTSNEVFDLFLCHTGANKDFVRDLATKLEGEQIDGRPLRVFFDEWDIAPGENVLARIEDGLRGARFFAVALSPALTRAAWPTTEWQTQVYDDPNGKRGRIIPLIVEKFDPQSLEPLEIPPVLRLLRYLDFSRPDRFAKQYDELLRRLRGLRPARGKHSAAETASAMALITGPEAADPVEEVLLGNALPVVKMPERIFSDRTTAKGYGEVWRSMTGPVRTPFVIHGGRLYSFVAPTFDANPFAVFHTGEDARVEKTVDWLADDDHRNHLVWMANDALKERCFGLRIRTPPGDRKQFYPPSFDGKPRMFSWGKGKSITLAKVSNTGERPLGVHRSARMRFMQLGPALHLLVEPGYFFTTDGVTPLEGRQIGILSVKWGGREGNDTVFRQTVMWARLLAAGGSNIDLAVGGGEVIVVAPVPIHGRANLGIANDLGNVLSLLSGENAGEVPREVERDELDIVAESHERGEFIDDDVILDASSAGLTDVGDIDDEPEAQEPSIDEVVR